MSSPKLLVLASMLFGATPDALGIEDPTRPPGTQAAVQATPARMVPSLKSILMSPGRRLAMIDDLVLVEGESAGGVKLLRVESNAVIVRTDNGERMTLTLGGNKIHKESK